MSISTRFKDLSKGEAFKISSLSKNVEDYLRYLLLFKISSTKAKDQLGNQYKLKPLVEVFREHEQAKKETEKWGVFDVLIPKNESTEDLAIKVFDSEKVAFEYVEKHDFDGKLGLIERPIVK